MDPLLIFSLILAWFGIAGIAMYVYRHTTTRKCPLCDAQVELGKPHCQVCGYKFTAARYY